MTFPERFSQLPPYAFPRLRSLLAGQEPGGPVVDMTIGSPLHPFPRWIGDVLAEMMDGFGPYPPNDGTYELRQEISDWVKRRYRKEVDPDTNVLPLNGTREGLFNSALALLPEEKADQRPVVLMPNPFYQVYAVAALAIGAEPRYLPATRETGYLPDFSAVPSDVLNRCVAAYICSPSNPQGAVADTAYWNSLLGLAEKFDFRVFADECYSEIYRNTQPVGILSAMDSAGADLERIVLFNSLSKRSNLAGLRSGFAISGEENVKRLKNLRNYAGAPMPSPLQRVAERVWADEEHVEANRALYREKLEYAAELFSDVPGFAAPEAGFFLWLPVEDGEAAAKRLWEKVGVKVLPGAYLGREADGENPGDSYIRAALVAPIDEVRPGLERLKSCVYG